MSCHNVINMSSYQYISDGWYMAKVIPINKTVLVTLTLSNWKWKSLYHDLVNLPQTPLLYENIHLSKLEVSVELRTTGLIGGFRFLSIKPLQSKPWNIIVLEKIRKQNRKLIRGGYHKKGRTYLVVIFQYTFL